MIAPERRIKRRCPDLDHVVKKVGGAVRVILVVLQDERDFRIGLPLVELGDGPVDLLCDACDDLRGLLPAATVSNVGIFASGQAYEELAEALPPKGDGA